MSMLDHKAIALWLVLILFSCDDGSSPPAPDSIGPAVDTVQTVKDLVVDTRDAGEDLQDAGNDMQDLVLADAAICSDGSTQACTTTHPGVCNTGQQTCSSAGWGPCVATIQPGSQQEVCGSTKDEDCDGKTDTADLDCPACTDKKQNGDETDVDCGGSTCPACAAGKQCKAAKDCATGLGCCNGTCTSLSTASNCGACGTVCPGVTACTSGKCTCPSKMVKQGSACVEDFNGAAPASGWTWSQNKSCPYAGCTSTATGATCKGCAKCTTVSTTACGNLGWTIISSPKSGGGKAMQVFTHATSGNCWQGDPLHKTYAIGRVIKSKSITLKVYIAGAGGGATWQCGNLGVALFKAGKQVGTKYYKDAIYGTHPCSGTVLQGNKQDFTFNLGTEIGEVDFDAIKLSLHKYSCVSGHWHTFTVDDITMQ